MSWTLVLKEAQDRLDHRFISSISVDHCMIERPVGPVDMEVILDESTTFTIDCLDQYSCVSFFLTF